ncbi:MAG: hypothetical protein PHZ09_07000, partial [Eubacteriales bacterium]|nr:hypothetical protein [Eubacteriales bacterium]
TVKEIYTDDDIAFIFPRFITDCRLYFSTVQIDKTKNTDGTLTRETTEEHLSIDLTTYDVIRTENKYGSRQNGEYYYSDGQYIFFADPGTGRLFVTDMNFENEITLLEYTDEYMISDMYYDMDTSELYVCVCSKYMEGMQGAQLEDGKIYCIDKGLNYRQLNMPTDKILDFRLTDKYIYYTIYDPVVYGVSPRGTSCIEENGNKIYRTPRSNPSGGELIFDGRNELFFFDYFITGNYLYIDYMQFMDEGGMNWFRVMGVTARIDMEKDTIKWQNLN